MAQKAIWLLNGPITSGPRIIELAGGRSITVIVNDNGFFETDEIPPPGYAVYVRPISHEEA